MHIAQDAQSEMQSVHLIVLEEGKGIFGDRYAVRKGTFSEQEADIKPDRQVTLIEKENLDDFNEKFASSFAYGDFRRNIVVSNCDLNALIGKEFQVGQVVLKGIRLCEPCKYLQGKLKGEGLLKALIGKGGLRAQIIKGGSIDLDAQIEV
jgi:MOSC domain-containing protein YiiM